MSFINYKLIIREVIKMDLTAMFGPLAALGAVVLVILMIWEAVWKGIGMWKAARNNQLAWFVCILIFNTIGILPIVYLLWFQKKTKAAKKVKKK